MHVRNWRLKIGILVGAAALVLGAVLLIVTYRSQRSEEAAADAADASTEGDSPLARELLGADAGAQHLADQELIAGVLATRSLAKAIDYARLSMADTFEKVDNGAALLAIWSANRLTWNELAEQPETSPMLFRKDPDERGKRLCLSGTLDSVRAERSLAQRLQRDRPPTFPNIPEAQAFAQGTREPSRRSAYSTGRAAAETSLLEDLQDPSLLFKTRSAEWDKHAPKLFFGFLTEESDKLKPDGGDRMTSADLPPPVVLSFIALRSTGQLVDGSKARFCGILTGVTAYPPGKGTPELGYRVVGMFDLPENRHATAEASKALSSTEPR
jgi:hypothetical protein